MFELLKIILFKELDSEHRRINEREYRQLPITTWFDETEKFKDNFAVVEVKRTRELKNKTTQETSYDITSLKEDEYQIYAEDGGKKFINHQTKIIEFSQSTSLKK